VSTVLWANALIGEVVTSDESDKYALYKHAAKLDDIGKRIAQKSFNSLCDTGNCLEHQVCAVCCAANSGFHRVAERTKTLRIVSSFRMRATSASFFGVPAATSR
jgi:hypothetical protein